MAVGEKGGMWTWGFRLFLGHINTQDRHVPTSLALEALDMAKPKMVAAGEMYTMAVLDDGLM